uniref:Uncharacterized protein n=1 Tax=Glossina pallidipes TaxID=7398 RepID=A0A1B0ACU3_GLOPL
MSLAAGVLLKHQTPLQQLLEDINFQRNKEMRQLLKDDSGFVVLQGTTYWTDLFVRHFLFQSEPVHSIDSDDLLFFVRKKHVKSSSRHMPKYETEVDVFRKDSRKLPIGDPDVDWEETVYLNMVIHQFDYTLTLAICTRTSPKELQVLRRHSQRVYASPSRRKMDTKGEGEEITYPHICFMVDNFDEVKQKTQKRKRLINKFRYLQVFSDILVRDGEMVCVELVANDKDGAVQGVIFLGSIRYDALKKVYDARQSSLSTKVAQRMSFGLFSSGAGVQTRCEFVRMKGPQGKGHAEMAVTKPKGSGVETPTSEPGFCATDMWDDWEEDNGDYCSYGHQRRLSDPSANLNNFSRYAWRTKSGGDAIGASGSAGVKARSENEGLDSLANEVSEIEAGDLRDDSHPAFSASKEQLHNHSNWKSTIRSESESEHKSKETTDVGVETNKYETEDMTLEVVADALEANVEVTNLPKNSAATPKKTTDKTTGCAGNCFKTGKKCKKRWVLSSDINTPEMSEIYCPTCDDFANETPACLNKMPDPKNKVKPKNIANLESELVISKRGSLRLNERKPFIKDRLIRSSSLSAADRKRGKKNEASFNKKEKPKIKDKEKDKIKEKLSKANSLLAKVSPKRVRANRNQIPEDAEKTRSNKEKNSHNNSKNSKRILNQDKSVAKQVSESLENNEVTPLQEYEIADDAVSLSGIELTQVAESEAKIAILTETDTKLMIAVRGQEELPVVEEPAESSASQTATTSEAISTNLLPTFSLTNSPSLSQNDNPVQTTCEFAKCVRVVVKNDDNHPLQQSQCPNDANSENDFEIVSSTDAKESLYKFNLKIDDDDNCHTSHTNRLSPMSPSSTSPVKISQSSTAEDKSDEKQGTSCSYVSTTLPRTKRSDAMMAHYNRVIHLVPKRRTPDGTNIYYWCDVPKQALKELDDGAYNPLWASRGFAQSFHFWKENKRQQSSPLNAFLTYVTLPWWSIAKDLLDHREAPILTF